jgi:hypothetical protein
MATAINAFSNAASMLSLHGIPYAISVCCSYKYNWDSYECVVLACGQNSWLERIEFRHSVITHSHPVPG